MSTPLEPSIRNAARALIVRDGHVLLLRKDDEIKGERFTLPGGAQEVGETLQEALLRECLEELGTEVRIRDLVHVADYFKQRATRPPTIRQAVEFLFACDVPENYQAASGRRPDGHQVGVVWAPLRVLHDLPVIPHLLVGLLTGQDGNGVYLGTIE
jgi:ADP-ribose pyrophosphatase YjhB (NUDIX family)